MLSQAVAVEYREQRTRVNSVVAMVLAIVTLDNCHQVLSPAVAAEHREQRSLLNATLSNATETLVLALDKTKTGLTLQLHNMSLDQGEAKT